MSNWRNWAQAHAQLEVAHRTITDCQILCADASHSLVFDISEARDLVDRVRKGLVRQIAHARHEPAEGVSVNG
jgi:hypothetical protein